MGFEGVAYRAREPSSNLDLVAPFDRNVAANGLVDWINILAILL
jgi:hypothetical protein